MNDTYYYPEVFEDLGRPFKVPVIEVGGMVINAVFLIIQLYCKKDLMLQRNEFKDGLFKMMTDKKSNFMWQISFYILKRLHIPVLLIIFAFGIKQLNIYYVGLLYFFVMYTSSLATYRKSGYTLIIYASFFIWIQ